MDEKTVKKLIAKWQKILSLSDESFELEVVSRADVDCLRDDEANICIGQDPCNQKSTIYVADDWLEEANEQEMEEGVIHELLHNVFHDAWGDKERNTWDNYTLMVLRERALNKTMRALARLSHKASA